ncbi:hypothetical protein PJ900_12250 [Tistrella mobilis]|uniref:hypothetical protein n=1 Tax=Tistrella mobilis TaxID=171437 RepID=UPI0012E9543D|nr:hypothetical protein [Tistrella mobilis]
MTDTTFYLSPVEDPKNDLRVLLSAWLFAWTPVGIRRGPGLIPTLMHISENNQLIPILHAYARRVAELAEQFLDCRGTPANDAGRHHACNAVTFGRGGADRTPCAVAATNAYLKACRMIYGSDPKSVAEFVATGKSIDRWLDFIELHEADMLSAILIDLLLDNDLII